jgi:hypothetical protein
MLFGKESKKEEGLNAWREETTTNLYVLRAGV